MRSRTKSRAARTMRSVVLITLMSSASLASGAQESRLSLVGCVGYAAAVNASYIDTYRNDDIYWNPNSGLSAGAALRVRLNDFVTIVFPLEVVLGLTSYPTTDGRKVNTEAQAGTNPDTTNTEWSAAPSLGAMVMVKTGRKTVSPYIALGACLGMLWSWETWEFVNAGGKETKLSMVKNYWPTPILRGELGWTVPVRDRWGVNTSITFSMANFVMRKVTLTHYVVDGRDRIDEYDEKSTVYTYSFDAPDENKGGDCLLAGFAYQNYPQQKISTNVCVRLGVVYNLR